MQYGENQRRHQTLIFWDYGDLDPEQLGTTVHRFTRRLLEFLRDEKIKSGGSVMKAYIGPHASQQVHQQLQDLQVTVQTTTKVKLALSTDWGEIAKTYRPNEVSVVLLANDKELVPSIKLLADDECFSVFVVHSIPKSNLSLTELMETYGTRSFHVSDVFGELLSTPTNTNNAVKNMGSLGSFGVAAGPPAPQFSPLGSSSNSNRILSQPQQQPQQQPQLITVPRPGNVVNGGLYFQQQSQQILVEGQLVRIDDILPNEGLQRIRAGVTSVKWCTFNVALHDPLLCSQLHRKLTPSQGSFTVAAPPPNNGAQNNVRASPPLPTYREHVNGVAVSPVQMPAVPRVPASSLQRGAGASAFQPLPPPAQQALPPPLPTASPWQRTAPSVVQETSRQAALQSNFLHPPAASTNTAWDVPSTSKEQAAQSMDLLLQGTASARGETSADGDDYLQQLALKMLGHSIAEELAVPVAPAVAAPPAANGPSSIAPGSAWQVQQLQADLAAIGNGKPQTKKPQVVAAPLPPPPQAPPQEYDDDSDDDGVMVNVESVMIPVSILVKNQAVEYLCRNPDKRGRWCQTKPTSAKPHDPHECTFVHALPGRGIMQETSSDEISEGVGKLFVNVAGKRCAVSSLAATKGVTYLLAHPDKQGRWCPTTGSHNIRECSYIHPLPGQAAPVGDAPKQQDTLPPPPPPPPAQRYRDAVAPSSDDDESNSPTMATILAQKVRQLAEPATTHVTVDGAVVKVKDLEQNEGLKKLLAGTARSWCKLSTQHVVADCKNIHKKKPSAVVAAAPRAKPSQPDSQSRKLPSKFNVDGESVPVSDLVHNKFIENYNGDNTGRWCTDSRPHSITQCTYAHRNQFSLLQGGKVDGSTLMHNLAYDNLLSNSHFRGNYCTSAKAHDPLKCTYLHKK